MLVLRTLMNQVNGMADRTLNGENFGRVAGLLLLIFVAACLRLLPHPVNFSPLAAIALFAGYQLRSQRLAYAFAFAALLFTDAFLGFHNTMFFVYLGFGLSVAVGSWLRAERNKSQKPRAQPFHIVGGTALSSLLFFVVSNFGVWFVGELYPRTWSGLVACFTMALPFYQNTVAGDFVFVAVIFAVWTLLEKRFLVFRAVEAA